MKLNFKISKEFNIKSTIWNLKGNDKCSWKRTVGFDWLWFLVELRKYNVS